MDLCFLKSLHGRATTKSLVAAIIKAIDGGLLRSGEKMPSSRETAQFTGASRTTVVRAFDELIARGYLRGKKGQATFVSCTASQPQTLSFEPAEEEKCQRTATAFPHELLPIRDWQKCMVARYSKLNANQLEAASEKNGTQALKQAICGFLRRTEGILCSARNIVIFTGTASALASIARMTADAGIACENKNSPEYLVFQKHHAIICELSIDSDGARIDAMGTARKGLKWLYITPMGCRTSGITLSDARRYEVLEWARINEGTIIENATGCEFQYQARTTNSLYAQDRSGSVIYHRSLSHLLQPLIEHQALTEFIDEGLLEKHIRASWKVLRRRRQTLIFALKQSFDSSAEIFSSHAGTEIIVRFAEKWSKDIIVNSALHAGFPLYESELAAADSNRCNEFIFDFSAMAEGKIAGMIQAFASGILESSSFSAPFLSGSLHSHRSALDSRYLHV
ncbi:MAG TPA: PLP-dependent aminotransferase family protein [Candidatus Melainabacteria bacterium]|nr:PLP-dependent aminotransferase family protein [Candidatus Melainabacteria bacterium]